MRGPAAAVCAALCVVPGAGSLTGCGGGSDGEQARPEPARVVSERVGSGAQSSYVVRPASDGPLPVVLFLHGWGGTLPATYGPWLDHLARAGNVVIYPRYQDSVLTPPDQVLGNLIAGVRLALERVEEEPGSLVVAGHSAGGALAADYAAIARQAGLPAPRAILSMYPGRRLRGIALGIPEVTPSLIGPSTRVVALAGAQDAVVGTEPARRIAASATRVPRERRAFVLISEPSVADHLGPQRSDSASRRVFWRRLDALLRTARG